MPTRSALQALVAHGESETLELRRSTAELWCASQPICTFSNGAGQWLKAEVVPGPPSRDQAGFKR